jgi:hypothetical protein
MIMVIASIGKKPKLQLLEMLSHMGAIDHDLYN